MNKLKSRKLWVALSGLATGIGMYVSGDKQNGVHTIMVSIAAYIGGESLADAAGALRSIIGNVLKDGGK